MAGSLQVVCGPMFSGKSEELIRRLRRSKIAGKNVALFSPDIDTRYGENLITHAGSEFPRIQIKSATDFYEQAQYYDVVGLDEVQFFNKLTLVAILQLANEIDVIVTGLDTNYRYEPFGIVPDLMAYAEKVDKLTAVCNKCGADATKTQRLINGQPAPLDGPEVLIGGLESYEARCRKCFQIG